MNASAVRRNTEDHPDLIVTIANALSALKVLMMLRQVPGRSKANESL